MFLDYGVLGPAVACISDEPPNGMFDGCETARSRAPGYFDWVEIRVPTEAARTFEELEYLVVDFTYFRHNNPVDMAFLGMNEETQQWVTIFDRIPVKAYASNSIALHLPSIGVVSGSDRQLRFSRYKIQQYPDGGFNRVKLLCTQGKSRL